MSFHVIQGNIDDDVESDIGAMPVQLPLTFHALRMKEKETESAALETDVKGTLLNFFFHKMFVRGAVSTSS